MSINDSEKINLEQLVNEFVNMVNEDSPDLSTDPNVRRVKVIKADGDCPGCSMSLDSEE